MCRLSCACVCVCFIPVYDTPDIAVPAHLREGLPPPHPQVPVPRHVRPFNSPQHLRHGHCGRRCCCRHPRGQRGRRKKWEHLHHRFAGLNAPPESLEVRSGGWQWDVRLVVGRWWWWSLGVPGDKRGLQHRGTQALWCYLAHDLARTRTRTWGRSKERES